MWLPRMKDDEINRRVGLRYNDTIGIDMYMMKTFICKMQLVLSQYP